MKSVGSVNYRLGSLESDDNYESDVTSTESNEKPDYMTVNETAKLLRINRNTLYDSIKRNEIPGVRRIGRNIRICRKTVIQWFRGKSLGTQSGRYTMSVRKRKRTRPNGSVRYIWMIHVRY